MRNKLVRAAVGGAMFAAVVAPGAASAEMSQPGQMSQPGMNQSAMPMGSELYGHTVRVDLPGGVVNDLMFHQDGTVMISSPSGGANAQGRWFVQNQMMCIELGSGARECWQYRGPFQAQQAVTMTSDCGVTSRWTAMSTNRPPAQPMQQRSGERG